MARGKLIVLEGVCGSGKSTAARYILQELQDHGHDAVYNHGASTYTETGRRFRELTRSLPAELSCAYYVADLLQDTLRQIRPRLDAGITVVQDRYIHSITSYVVARSQRSERPLDIRPVIDLYTELGLFEIPAVTIWCKAPRDLIVTRLSAAEPSRMHRQFTEDPMFIDQVQAGFEHVLPGDSRSIAVETHLPGELEKPSYPRLLEAMSDLNLC